MDQQLEWITSLLSDLSVEYWVESGSLLTLWRDHKLTNADDDIDIGAWDKDKQTILSEIKGNKKENYYIQTRGYRGNVHKVKIIPKDDGRTIDLQLFRQNDTHIWVPLAKFNGVTGHPLEKSVIDSVYPIIKHYARNKEGHISIDKGLRSLPIDILTLYLPNKYHNSIQYDEQLGFNRPKYCDEYLSLRYGYWQEPVKSWNLLYDGGIRPQEPRELIRDSSGSYDT